MITTREAIGAALRALFDVIILLLAVPVLLLWTPLAFVAISFGWEAPGDALDEWCEAADDYAVDAIARMEAASSRIAARINREREP